MGAAPAQSGPPAGRQAAPPGAAGGAIRREFNAAGQPIWGEHRGYAYDAAWNLAWRTNALWPHWFQVDGKNQLTNALTTGAQVHDANGNLLSRAAGPWSYGWDDENRLVALTNHSQGTRTALVYDGLSRLRVRQEWSWVAYTNNPPDSASAALPGGGLAAGRRCSCPAGAAAAATGSWPARRATCMTGGGWCRSGTPTTRRKSATRGETT